jgi:hypothetical protein
MPELEELSFEDYLRVQLELGASISLGMGSAADGSPSIVTFSDKIEGAHFWAVAGNAISHLGYMKDYDLPEDEA